MMMKEIRTIFQVTIGILFFIICTVAAAEATSVASPAQAMGKTLFVLVGIISLIIGLAWLAKRFGVNNLAGQKDIKAIAQIPLGQREKAVLIEVHGKKILLGVAQGHVSTLHVFNDASIEQTNNTQSSAEEAAEVNESISSVSHPSFYSKNDDGLNSNGLNDNAQSIAVGLNFPVLFRANKRKISCKENVSETSEFSSFLKKILSNGRVDQ